MAKPGEFTIDRGRPDFKIHSFCSLNTVFALFTHAYALIEVTMYNLSDMKGPLTPAGASASGPVCWTSETECGMRTRVIHHVEFEPRYETGKKGGGP